MKVSVVIPCYNSSNSVENVINRIEKEFMQDGRYDFEIICVNDYSPDNTLEVLKSRAYVDQKLKVIALSKNFGQHSALMAGFNYVTGDIVLCLDDDGQTPPEQMFLLINKLNEGFDLVSAKYPNKKHSLFRKIGSKVSMAMSTYLVGKPRDIDLNSFCVCKRFVINEVIKYKNAYPFVHGLMLRVTRNIANVNIEHHERESGSSGYNFTKLVGLWMNGFTAFSEKPLRIATFFGVILSIVGFILGIVTIARKIINPEIIAGYSSIMAALLFISGLLFMFLGLLGEYIGRIYICINNAPQYSIREKYNLD